MEFSDGRRYPPPMTDLDEAARISAAYAKALPIDQKRFDSLAAEIARWAAAGYDLDAAIPFWRRYLGKYDWFPQIFRSHPSLGARERIAAEEIAAIRREKAGL